MDEQQLAQIKEALDKARNVVITNHVNPDGDAVGSALALAGLLSLLQKEVQVIMPNEYPQNLHWISGFDQVMFYSEQEVQCQEYIDRADLIVHLDYNALSRSGPMKETLEKSRAEKMVIDHHREPDSFPDVLLSDASMSSTSEMVFHLAVALQWESLIDRSIAEAIYAGIITDTGNFRFNSTTAATHRAASFLLESGVRPDVVASRIYDNNSQGRMLLLSSALKGMDVREEWGTAIISLSEEELQKHHFQKGDTEGFVNYGLSLSAVELSIFTYEWEGKVKMSFRSKTDFDVNSLARKHFDGGGHRNAAGALSDRGLEETKEKLIEILPDYAEELRSLANYEI